MTDKIDTTIHRAELAGYSSIVGQPIMLLNKAGACIGQLSLIGARGDYKAMTAEVAGLINGEALRAEAERLTAACTKWAEVSQGNYQRAKSAEAEVERLRGELRGLESSAINAVGALRYSANEIYELENTISNYRGNDATAISAYQDLEAALSTLDVGAS